MCGIVGLFSFSGPPVLANQIRAMSERVAHRGPDGHGLWISDDGRVGMGHRRLSIIDLSIAAAQPMASVDKSIQLVFNGEIFNHAEIRAELESLDNRHWCTDHSDTEVIINAYLQWGTGCLARFRGDFAIALWDSRKQSLWLARDRAGVKPLYYVRLPGGIAFASEIKALLALPQVPREIDMESLYHYLSFLTPPAPRTMFAGIEKMPAATYMVVGNTGEIQTKRYWDPMGDNPTLYGLSDGEIQEAVLAELRRSVRYRKVSDVPVGIFLSGGIDSSANAVLFAEDGDLVSTFSIGYDAEYASYASELPYAKKMADRIGAQHHVRRLQVSDVADFIEKMVYHQDEPIGDVVCVPLYYVAKLARDAGVIACQVGEGSDELFCGYPYWRQHLKIARWNAYPVPRAAKQLGLGLLRGMGKANSYPYELLRRAANGEPTFWGGAEGLTQAEKLSILGPELRKRFEGFSSAVMLEPILTRFKATAGEHSSLNWMTYLDLNLRLPELLLPRVDKMTMATGVEGRVPFLDHKFIELAMSIPTANKVGDMELKRVLKGAMRGILPDDLIDRPKQGFGLPMREWLGGELGREIERRVLHFSETTGIFDREITAGFLRKEPWSKIWLLYNLAVWYERFISGDGTYGGSTSI